MLFNSPEFIVFLLIVYCVYLLLSFRQQNYMLLFASYIFYGWWDARFLFLVALSTTVDYWVGLMLANDRLTCRERVLPAIYLAISAIAFLGLKPDVLWENYHGAAWIDFIRIPMIQWAFWGIIGFLAFMGVAYWGLQRVKGPRRRLLCLMVSLVTQLGLLGVFKYFNFFADSLSVALNSIGIQSSALHLNIILPVGVSFYTFQSLSYTIDIYRRELKPTNRFFDFALFVAYFPQLQAGPIERARHLLPQLATPRHPTFDQLSRGLYLIVLGFFKKVAIADGVAPIVDQVFGTTGRVTWSDVVGGTVLFAIQIYCDFSGYTDIARGISKLFGIELMVNFNQPYFSTNPQDFWRRWHISLSTWLRDYLYVPLGGNRGDLLYVCRNLLITMLLGGLWHGAAWNFVLWGFYQGLMLCVYRIWHNSSQVAPSRKIPEGIELAAQKSPTLKHSLSHFAIIAVFFVFTCYGWLLFRAHSLEQIIEFTSVLFTDFGNTDYGAGLPRLSSLLGLPLLVAMELVQFWKSDAHWYQRFSMVLRGLLIAAMITITIMGMSNEPAQFIYFQF